MARPTKLNPQRQKRILSAIVHGNTYRASAGAGGVTEETLLSWRHRGQAEEARLAENPARRVRKAEEPFLRFFRAFTRAEDLFERRTLAHIERAEPTDWRAAGWLLERRRKVAFGPPPRESIHMEGRVGPGPDEGAMEFTFKVDAPAYERDREEASDDGDTED